MIRCRRRHLENRCRERGYTWDEVRPCVVADDGDDITVDETHPAYPRTAKTYPAAGPGTELKALLKRWLGIVATPNCPCNAHALQMDLWGPDECERRLDEIVGWLEEEAARRRLPFVRLLAAKMVRLAISRARTAAGR